MTEETGGVLKVIICCCTLLTKNEDHQKQHLRSLSCWNFLLFTVDFFLLHFYFFSATILRYIQHFHLEWKVRFYSCDALTPHLLLACLVNLCGLLPQKTNVCFIVRIKHITSNIQMRKNPSVI